MSSPKLSRNRKISRSPGEISSERSPEREISKGFKGRSYRERSRSRSETKDSPKKVKKRNKEKVMKRAMSPERFEKCSSASRERSPENRKVSKRRISVSPKKHKRRSESSSSRSPSTSRKVRSSSHQKGSINKKKSRKKSKKRKKSSRTSESESSVSSPTKKIKKEKDNAKKSAGLVPSSPEYRPTVEPEYSPEYRPNTTLQSISENYANSSPEYRPTSPTRSRSVSPKRLKKLNKSHKSRDHDFIKPSSSGYKIKSDPDSTPHHSRKKYYGDRGVCSPPRNEKREKDEYSPPRSKTRERSPYSLSRSKTRERGVCSPPRSKTRDKGECSLPRSKTRDKGECSPPRSKTRDKGECSPPYRSTTRERGVCSPPRSKTRERGVCSPPSRSKTRDRAEGPDPFNLKGLDDMIIRPHSSSKSRHPSKASSSGDRTPPSSRNLSPTDRAYSSHARTPRDISLSSSSQTTRDISQSSSQSVSLIPSSSIPAVPAVLIKTEPDLDEQDMVILPPMDVSVGKGVYFKPDRPNVPQQFGKIYCHLCSAYIEDDDTKKSLHLKQEHQFHVFKVTLPRDIFLCDIEEVIAHYAKLDIDNGDIATKLFDCNLVINPPSLEAFTCGKCPEGQRFTNFTSVDECYQHIRDTCKVPAKDLQKYVIPWCRLCHSRYESISQLYQHTNYTREVNYKNNKKNKPCFPNKKIRDKIYDSVKNKPMIQPDAAVKREIKEFFNSQPDVMEVLERPSVPAIDAYKNFSENLQAQNTAGEPFNIFSDLEQPTADVQSMIQPRRVRHPSMTELQNILNAVGGGVGSAQIPNMSTPPPGYPGLSQQPSSGFYPSTKPNNPFSQPRFPDPNIGANIEQHWNSMAPVPPSLGPTHPGYRNAPPLPASLGPSHPGYRNAPPGMFGAHQRPSLRLDVSTAILRAKKEVLVKREPKLSELFESQVRSSQQDPNSSIVRVTPSPTPTCSSYPSPSSSTDPSPKNKSTLMFVPPPPSTPLPSKDDLFNEASAGLNLDVGLSVSPPPPRASPVQSYERSSQHLVSPVQPYERPSSSCYSVNSDDSVQLSPIRVINEEKCRTSSCRWDDRHSGECSKPAIKIRCDSEICDDKDLHVNEYNRACPKLNHNCSNVPRKNISLEIQSAEKESSINEGKHVPWRLLYKKTSTVVSDPRLGVDNYPRRSLSPNPSRVLDVWFINPSEERPEGGDVKVYAWSCLEVRELSFNFNNNPHKVEESDDEIEVEYEGPTVSTVTRKSSVEKEVEAVGERRITRKSSVEKEVEAVGERRREEYREERSEGGNT